MPAELPPFAVSLVVIVALGSLLVWSQIIRWWSLQQPLLPEVRFRHVPWGGIPVVFFGLMHFLLPSVLAGSLGMEGHLEAARGDVDSFATTLLLYSACQLVSISMIVLMLAFGFAATRSDLGFGESGSLKRDSVVAVAGFLAAALPVYTIQSVLTRWVSYQHPVLDVLTEGHSPLAWSAAWTTAVVSAPIAEEFLFRLVLQGWLEKRFGYGEREPGNSTVTEDDLTGPEQMISAQQTIGPDDSIGSGNTSSPEMPPAHFPHSRHGDNPFQSPLAAGSDRSQPGEPLTTQAGLDARAVMPIVISSSVFALMHWGQGPAPVPLFVLALFLGFLFQKTRRLLPCILLHAIFNGFSLLLLSLST